MLVRLRRGGRRRGLGRPERRPPRRQPADLRDELRDRRPDVAAEGPRASLGRQLDDPLQLGERHAQQRERLVLLQLRREPRTPRTSRTARTPTSSSTRSAPRAARRSSPSRSSAGRRSTGRDAGGSRSRKYGAQQQTECSATGNASWCNPDAGNGVKPNNANVTGNDPADTSKTIDATFVTRWMAHLAGAHRDGRRGRRPPLGARQRADALELDAPRRPPGGHDVRRALGEDGDDRRRDQGAGPRREDPRPGRSGAGARTSTPARTAARPAPTAPRTANVDFIPWYLEQAKAWETAHGARLLDYLDVHYYPQADGRRAPTDESAATSALRLRTLKSLYDPTYLDESWIGTDVGQAVYLIPRMKAWIAAHYPGTKLAISEYNWGYDDGISGALAQAEALAIFGREGVDLATRWVAPADGSLTRTRSSSTATTTARARRWRATPCARRARTWTSSARTRSAAARAGTRSTCSSSTRTSPRRPSRRHGRGRALRRRVALPFHGRVAPRGGRARAAPSGGTLTLTLPARSATLAVVALPVDDAPSGRHVVPRRAALPLPRYARRRRSRARRERTPRVRPDGRVRDPGDGDRRLRERHGHGAVLRRQSRRVPCRSRAATRHEHAQLRRGPDAREQRDAPPRARRLRQGRVHRADAVRHRPPRRGRQRMVGVGPSGFTLSGVTRTLLLATALFASPALAQAPPREIAVTIDDLPLVGSDLPLSALRAIDGEASRGADEGVDPVRRVRQRGQALPDRRGGRAHRAPAPRGGTRAPSSATTRSRTPRSTRRRFPPSRRTSCAGRR